MRQPVGAVIAAAALAALAGCAARARTGDPAAENADLRRMLLETRRDLEEVRRDQDRLRDAVENLQAQGGQPRPPNPTSYGAWPGESLGIGTESAGVAGSIAGQGTEVAQTPGSPVAVATPDQQRTAAANSSVAGVAPQAPDQSDAPGGQVHVAAVPPPEPVLLGVSTPPPMVPTSLRGGGYEDAVRAFNEEHYEDSIQYFRDFVYKSPESEYADDAQFWIAESYLRKQLYSNAIKEFNQVVLRYGTGDRGAGALLKLAEVFSRIGDQVDARLSLQKLVNRYPGSDEAAEAYRLLKQMGT